VGAAKVPKEPTAEVPKTSLRALAARKLPQVRHLWCCRTAVNPDIHAAYSKSEAVNSPGANTRR
jgi:hypothetical protein